MTNAALEHGDEPGEPLEAAPGWVLLECGMHMARRDLGACARCAAHAKTLAHELESKRVKNAHEGYDLVHGDDAPAPPPPVRRELPPDDTDYAALDEAIERERAERLAADAARAAAEIQRWPGGAKARGRRMRAIASVGAGESVRAVAQREGVSTATVYMWITTASAAPSPTVTTQPKAIEKARVSAPAPKRSRAGSRDRWRIPAEVREEILARCRAGETQRAVARAYGVNESTIAVWIRRGLGAAPASIPRGTGTAAPPSDTRTDAAPAAERDSAASLSSIHRSSDDSPFSEVVGTTSRKVSTTLADESLRPGTREFRARFVARVLAGESQASVARDMGVPKSSGEAWVRTAKVAQARAHAKHVPPEVRARALALLREGATLSATSRAIGVKIDSVRRWRDDEQAGYLEEAVRRYDAGETVPDIADAMNVRPRIVYGWLETARPGSRIPRTSEERALPRTDDELVEVLERGAAERVQTWSGRVPDDVRVAALQRIAAGESKSSVAASIGVTRGTISDWIAAAKSPAEKRGCGYPAERIAELVGRVRDGESIASVARSSGVTPTTIAKWCTRAGVKSSFDPVPHGAAAHVRHRGAPPTNALLGGLRHGGANPGTTNVSDGDDSYARAALSTISALLRGPLTLDALAKVRSHLDAYEQLTGVADG